MPIKAVVYADLQATEGPERCYFDPTLPLQRHRIDLFWNRIHEIYKEHSCNAVWDLGDTTDDRVAIPIPTLNKIRDGVRRFPDSDFNVKIIGNHEQFVRNTTVHNGCIFEPKFQVVDQVQVFHMEQVVVIAISYPSSEAALAEKLDSLLLKYRNEPILILGHFEVSGCRTKDGTILTGLNQDLLNRAQATILGHIHLPQVVGQTIYYIGSPFQQDFGESGEDKQVFLITLDKGEIQIETVPMLGFPRYRQLTLQEYVDQFDPKSEDRLKVILKSAAEATAFYKLPHSGRARIVYDFQVLAKTTSGNSDTVVDWGLKSATKRYASKYKASEAGIQLSDIDLLEVGISIAEGPQL